MRSISDKRKSARVFVAGAFTTAHEASTGFHQQTKRRLQLIHSFVSRNGCTYYSSHIEEKWGDSLATPAALALRDIRWIEQCTQMIVYLGNVHSPGVLIELGCMVAMKKPVLAVIEKGCRPCSDFYLGIVKNGWVEETIWESEDQLADCISKFLSQ
ncbi:nucleoside 2-deoxyribosyltransferase [Planctomycetota bacterium]